MTPDLLGKIIAKISYRGECWLWTGSVVKRGQVPRFHADKEYNVRRFFYEREHGPLGKAGLRNTCGNLLCVNPAHWQPIETVTQAERSRKYRQKRLRGISGVRALARRCGFRLERVGHGRYVVERAA